MNNRLVFSLLTLSIGITAGIGLGACIPVLAQSQPASAQYVEEKVIVFGAEIHVLEDRKRNRLCYIGVQEAGRGDNATGAIDCGPLNRNNSL